MSDYIKREDAVTDAFCDGVSCQECPFLVHPINGGCKVADFMMSLPAADVVEVVRCKDCKHLFDTVCCDQFWTRVAENDFCSHGERR